MPAMMRAIAIASPGGPEALVLEERPVPAPAPGEILVRVAAAGVNRLDILQRKGNYPVPPGASDLPGLEVAGTVAETGPGVSRWQVGDQVAVLMAGGGYAQYATVAESCALPVPEGLSMVEAAALPEATFTVWNNVFERGALREGETFLVHGGTSGIGMTAIQIAKARGARVIATAGSEEKLAACLGWGADHAVNYRTADFVAEVMAATEGKGADVILDMVGGDYTGRNLEAAAEEGRIVQIAFLKGSRVTADLRLLMTKRLILTGSTLRARSIAFKAKLAEAVEREVWPLIASGRLKPAVHATLPLEQAREAHELMETSSHMGKIILKVD
ncbi:NAD(P)H quinone oxidoreductase [Agaricicola taiwanensis]|uniref:NAD(P)H quinone oxidoreductase n=1 Tax=Agaricicola taiwanensis TaxID=591372 RepID=A0A8J2VVB4_9RHOB|nr:NAD(P)H-quinone oxidoreductase [Agaricicola taiwanensis]GGE38802.1 NAD(P)H quinone oxidoreductase [Agaricicola taiwanensis]